MASPFPQKLMKLRESDFIAYLLFSFQIDTLQLTKRGATNLRDLNLVQRNGRSAFRIEFNGNRQNRASLVEIPDAQSQVSKALKVFRLAIERECLFENS